MAVRRKNFSTTKPQGSDDVIVLDVNAGTPLQASFQCVNRIPGMVLLDFISSLDEDNPQAMGQAVSGFIKSALRPEHYESFTGYCRDPKHDVGLEELTEMCAWLAEQYTGENPTQSSSGSTPGSPTSGPGLWEPPLGPESTPADFPLTSSSFSG